jgi:hypothetical protein
MPTLETLEGLVKAKKSEMRRNLRRKNKKLFTFLDSLLILTLLFNFSAGAITNALVVKAHPQQVFYETNAAVAKSNNYAQKQEALDMFAWFFMDMLHWGIVIAFYAYFRFTIMSEEYMYIFSVMFIMLFIVLQMDFRNDFGYYIGTIFFR